LYVAIQEGIEIYIRNCFEIASMTKVTIFLHYEEEWQRRTAKSSIILSGSLHFF